MQKVKVGGLKSESYPRQKYETEKQLKQKVLGAWLK
jgi:hypothetical protein